ncbi:uncharacterized protein LOC111344742 [Stylophora pistillata]|uniref:uncharacterized protein LOC111344742 n=1 Tax=Stylophora pistillata TaxID=50429 RepID=UPI000C054F69|nr:uncharacterized protein LOC111344742 [Stylophora pistillata]
MLVLKRCLVRQLCRHPDVSLLCLLAGMLYIYTILSSSEDPKFRVLHPRFSKDPEMDKAISGLSELAPNKFDETRPVSLNTLESDVTQEKNADDDDSRPPTETTTKLIFLNNVNAREDTLQMQSKVSKETTDDVIPAQSQNDDVITTEVIIAEPIRSPVAQSQNDDVKQTEETTAEPTRSHAAQSQNDDVKPAEETTAEPIRSHAAQSQNDDVKPSEVTTAKPIRSRVAQSRNEDVITTEVTMTKPSLQTNLQREEEVSYTQEKQMEMPGGNMKCEANESCHGFPVESPEQAKIICNKYGPRCKGFVYSLRSGKFIPKSELANKVVFSTEHDLYVKSDFEQSSKTLQHGSCALPLDQFQSFSDGCHLPKLDPNDKSIIKLISRPNPIQCPGFQLTRYEGGILELTEETSRVDNISALSYQPILRPDHKDWGFESGNVVSLQAHERKFQLGLEFVRVQLSTADGKKHVEYHAQVVPRSLEHVISKVGLPLSVVIIGFDSLSAAHFQRALPEAYKFMSEELNSLFFKGYSIVGDGTTPALTALMTGKFESELPEARRQLPDTASLDRWPHIFKDFKEKGYATLFSEDCPAYGAFNYRLHGFTEPPTDHFSRFFWEAAHVTSAHCIHSKKQHRIHFDYLRSFFKAYRERPKFGLFFLTDISHNNLKSIYHCADDFSALLRDLSEGNFLNDTLLVVMSDHGFRYGDTRATFQGKLEERLPIMSLTFPRWFLQQYPELIHNLKENSDIVTSPFDLYATFKHILSYPQAPANLTRGKSLLTTIDRSRDCKRAGVAEHYCPCIQWKEIDTSVMHVQRAAQAVVDHVNNLTASDPLSLSLCSRLEIEKVLSAYQKLPNIKIAQFLGSYDVHGRKPMFSRGDVTVSECLYQVQIQTVPGNGLYEASVNALDGEYRVTGDVSRINLYGEQPRCILEKRPDLRKFCLCKDYDGQ